MWQIRASYDQKPYRRLMMQTRGAKVYPSPSMITEAGQKILQMDPSSPGKQRNNHIKQVTRILLLLFMYVFHDIILFACLRL